QPTKNPPPRLDNCPVPNYLLDGFKVEVQAEAALQPAVRPGFPMENPRLARPKPSRWGFMSSSREPNAEPIPGYRLIEPLGCGGFGEVWKCEAPGGLFKAIKFVYGSLKSLDDEGARADQEYKALNRVKEVRHPFVLSVERIDVLNGELLIVMELADKN